MVAQETLQNGILEARRGRGKGPGLSQLRAPEPPVCLPRGRAPVGSALPTRPVEDRLWKPPLNSLLGRALGWDVLSLRTHLLWPLRALRAPLWLRTDPVLLSPLAGTTLPHWPLGELGRLRPPATSSTGGARGELLGFLLLQRLLSSSGPLNPMSPKPLVPDAPLCIVVSRPSHTSEHPCLCPGPSLVPAARSSAPQTPAPPGSPPCPSPRRSPARLAPRRPRVPRVLVGAVLQSAVRACPVPVGRWPLPGRASTSSVTCPETPLSAELSGSPQCPRPQLSPACPPLLRRHCCARGTQCVGPGPLGGVTEVTGWPGGLSCFRPTPPVLRARCVPAPVSMNQILTGLPGLGTGLTLVSSNGNTCRCVCSRWRWLRTPLLLEISHCALYLDTVNKQGQ